MSGVSDSTMRAAQAEILPSASLSRYKRRDAIHPSWEINMMDRSHQSCFLYGLSLARIPSLKNQTKVILVSFTPLD